MAVAFDRKSFPLVTCEHCLVKLHSCDLDDHVEGVCPFASIPCINKSLGCSAKTTRRAMASHLQSCPASTVICMQCHEKYSSSSGDDREQPGPASRTSYHDYRCVFRRDEYQHHYEDVHINMISAKALRKHCPWHGYTDCEHDGSAGGGETLVPFNEHWTVKELPDGVSVIRQASVVGSGAGAGSSSTSADNDGDIASQGAEEAQSSELSHYGYDKEDVVGPSSAGGAYLPRQLSQAEELAFYGYDSADRDDVDDDEMRLGLADLPREVCLMVLSHLDSHSLSQVARTCHTLRNRCAEKVAERGIVQLQWEKSDSGWRRVANRWHFTTSSTHVGKENWHLLPNKPQPEHHTAKHHESGRQDLADKAAGSNQVLPDAEGVLPQ